VETNLAVTLEESTKDWSPQKWAQVALRCATSIEALHAALRRFRELRTRRFDEPWAPEACLWLLAQGVLKIDREAAKGVDQQGCVTLQTIFLSCAPEHCETRGRLSALFRVDPAAPPEGLQTWDSTCTLPEFDEWLKSEGVFIVDGETGRQRWQTRGSCFLNTEAALFDNLCIRAELLEKERMFDAGDIVRRFFSVKLLEEAVLGDNGANTEERVRSALDRCDATIDTFSTLPETVDEIEKARALFACGPVVVTKFQIHAHLSQKDLFVYDALERGSGWLSDKHALLIIGVGVLRRKLFYLLKNWWVGKQFILASADYLRAVKAQFHMVSGKLKKAPSLASTVTRCAEGSFCEGGDREPREAE
jgi:hypothetical protein